ncbi:MAG: glutathione S-transferase family protein [Siculibacillus sp.]|nr:glutathione S-transferase family protein [Siculibacillus sp.]
MIELHQFAPVDGVNLSPFCAKVETYLRLRRIPHRVVVDPPFKGPKGKLPFIVDGPTTIDDSSQILAHLEATRPDPLDAGLDAAARATAHLVKRTLEESLYFAMLFDRWADDANWPRTRDALFAAIPKAVRPAVTALIRRKILRDLKGEGTGKMTPEEVAGRGAADIAAVAEVLGERDFLVCDRVTTIDVVLFAFIDNLSRGGFAGPLREAATASAGLVGHHRRMTALLAASASADPG